MCLTKTFFCAYLEFCKQAGALFFVDVKKVFYHRQVQGFPEPAGAGHEQHMVVVFMKFLDEQRLVYEVTIVSDDVFILDGNRFCANE